MEQWSSYELASTSLQETTKVGNRKIKTSSCDFFRYIGTGLRNNDVHFSENDLRRAATVGQTDLDERAVKLFDPYSINTPRSKVY